MVKNLPTSAGDTGLIPGQGTKIPTTRGTTKPMRAATTEPTPQLEKSPHSATKMLRAAMKIPHTTTKTLPSQLSIFVKKEEKKKVNVNKTDS